MAALRMGSHLQGHVARDGRDLHLRALVGLGHRQRYVEVQIVLLAPEPAVGRHVDVEEEVTLGAAVLGGAAVARDTHPAAVGRAGGDADGDRRGAALRSELERRPSNGGGEVDRDAALVVRPRLRSATTPDAAAQEVAEHVVHVAAARAAEEILDPHAARAPTAHAAAAARLLLRPLLVGPHPIGIEPLAKRLLPELVVELALLRVAQDLEGVVDLLEAGFRGLVARVLVGVKLLRELAVSLLDRIGVGRLRDTQGSVEIISHRGGRNVRRL